MRKKLSQWQRILRIMEFYRKRGQNRENLNEVYRKINLIRFKELHKNTIFEL